MMSNCGIGAVGNTITVLCLLHPSHLCSHCCGGIRQVLPPPHEVRDGPALISHVGIMT